MKKLLITNLILAIFAGGLFAQDFPEPMKPPRLVNDFTGLLDARDASALENQLLSFYNKTSTQIYVVTVPTLQGYDPNDYTTQLAEKWGVGTKGKDNGVMILIKPKTADERGEVYIAVGYGLEGVLTDLQANRIVQLEVLPRFRQGNYAGGIEAAVDVIMKITEGEFTADQYLKQRTQKKAGSVIPLIIMIILFSIFFGGRSRMNRHQSFGGSLPFWLLLGMMGRGNGGSFGGFSSGGGFGGGFGGFGGGGGGSFGGGGAGGSW
jgi:uncharacterized protein